MTTSQVPRGPQAVTRFLKPRSIAIVGISPRAGTTGQIVLQSLKVNEFQGDIHLVGRSAEPIDGRPVLKSAEQLPEGVDLAVFALPAAGVRDAIADCAKRKVGSALVFAAGFAESGNKKVQEQISTIARDGGLAVVGPNCVGYTNNVDGLMIHMAFANKAGRFGEGSRPGLAYVGQSGGVLGHFQRVMNLRKVPLSYAVSIGNEAGLELTDFMEFLATDAATSVLVLYAEQVRRPEAFLDAVRRCRLAEKPVVLLFPGRSLKSRQAAQSHTGALVGDHATMRVLVEDAGAIVVDTIDEMTDLAELLAHYPKPKPQGPAVLTASGAYVAVINDFAENLDLEFPALAPATLKVLNDVLPPYGSYGNPLDATAGYSAEALSVAIKALLADQNVGSLFISFPLNTALMVQSLNKGMEGTDKPRILVPLGENSPLTADVIEEVQRTPAIFAHSADRVLRALALYTRYGVRLAEDRSQSGPDEILELPKVGRGSQPEWLGKKLLAAAGIRVPFGQLARSVNEALEVARTIGYPVVLKAQAAALAHKTEAGGVALNIKTDDELRAAYDSMLLSIKRAASSIVLDGVLVEKMSAKGIELMIGAKRDPLWGTVLLVGLGGIWVEALGDVRLLPGDAGEAQIAEALKNLRSAKLLSGIRGAPPSDINAVVHAVMAVGRLMRSAPNLTEIDVNPLMVHAAGEGVTALDALMVAR